ncbi:c-type cytochrome [Effusibacillus consociatus]|uniref:C-type cytochrome n=1 Tax=Effusibacillus consociatus TaxID=1117041 RepID=A0ABV9Q3V3_9BACL
MKQYLKGLLVAAVPATLGILFGLGIIFYGLNHMHKTEEASAKPAEDKKQTQSSGTANADMKSFVQQNCASCHGADLKGNVGPSLVAAGQKLSEQDIAKVLKEGRGIMPKGLANGKEAEVAKYLKSLK